MDPSSPFATFADVVCPVHLILGSGSISVRECLTLAPDTVIKLNQAIGEDLLVQVNGVVVARGEVVMIEESAALRLTHIEGPLGPESEAS